MDLTVTIIIRYSRDHYLDDRSLHHSSFTLSTIQTLPLHNQAKFTRKLYYGYDYYNASSWNELHSRFYQTSMPFGLFQFMLSIYMTYTSLYVCQTSAIKPSGCTSAHHVRVMVNGMSFLENWTTETIYGRSTTLQYHQPSTNSLHSSYQPNCLVIVTAW